MKVMLKNYLVILKEGDKQQAGMTNKFLLFTENFHCGRSTYAGKAYFFSFFFFLFSFFAFAQEASVSAEIDSSNIQIGEQIIYSIKIETDSSDLVIFPEGQNFSPLEMVESFTPDTTSIEDRFRLIKEYTLTQFDSGRYTIPRQRVLINDEEYFTDSLRIEVADVVVDTTKQKMYPIKPSVEVPGTFKFPGWFWWVLAMVLILGVVFYFFRRKKKKEEAEKELPPYEQAVFELKQLDDSPLLEQREIKEYYSQLTGAIRKYLDREVYERALGSTTNQLIAHLELKRHAGELKLNEKTIQHLKLILERADLAKFANSRPDVITAKTDRTKIGHVINDVKTSIPAPKEEDLMQDEEFRKALLRKRKRRRIIIGVAVGFFVLLIAVTALAATKGIGFVKDAIFGHPTKELLQGDWIRSEYGNPAVAITTPEVLKRGEMDMSNEVRQMLVGSETFMYGSLISNFYVVVSTIKFNDEVNFNLDTAVDGVYQNLENQGARNIIIKEEDFSTISGAEGIKVYGTLNVENPVTRQNVQKQYMILNLAENKGFQQITVIFNEDDSYAEEISERIINSVELKNSN